MERSAYQHGGWEIRFFPATFEMRNPTQVILQPGQQAQQAMGAPPEERMPRLAGYGSVYNAMSLPFGMAREMVQRGAMDNSLRENMHDQMALASHDMGQVLGSRRNGTLSMRSDEVGLHVEIDPPNTTYARDMMESVRRGDTKHMSIGFSVRGDRWEMRNNEPIRIIEEMDLMEVSVVAMPAYPDTSVALRSYNHFLASGGMNQRSMVQVPCYIQPDGTLVPVQQTAQTPTVAAPNQPVVVSPYMAPAAPVVAAPTAPVLAAAPAPGAPAPAPGAPAAPVADPAAPPVAAAPAAPAPAPAAPAPAAPAAPVVPDVRNIPPGYVLVPANTVPVQVAPAQQVRGWDPSVAVPPAYWPTTSPGTPSPGAPAEHIDPMTQRLLFERLDNLGAADSPAQSVN